MLTPSIWHHPRTTESFRKANKWRKDHALAQSSCSKWRLMRVLDSKLAFEGKTFGLGGKPHSQSSSNLYPRGVDLGRFSPSDLDGDLRKIGFNKGP